MLRILEESLLNAIETMQVGVTLQDLQGTILYANAAEAKMHGYSTQELVGKNVGLFSPVNRRSPLTRERFDQIRSWKRESVNRRKNGETFPVQLMSDVVRDNQGHPIALITTCEDLSEKTAAEMEIAQRRCAQDLYKEQRELLM